MSRAGLENGIRTIVDGVAQLVKVVKQSQPGSASADLTNSARPLIQGLKDLVSKVLAPNGHWRAPNLESTAQALKTNILGLVQRAREAYSNRSSTTAIANLDQQARTTIYSAKQIVRVWQSSVNGGARKTSFSGETPSTGSEGGSGRRRRGGGNTISMTLTDEQKQQQAWQLRKSELENREATRSNRKSQAFAAAGANRTSGVMTSSPVNTRTSGVVNPSAFQGRGSQAFSGPEAIKQKPATGEGLNALPAREDLLRRSRKSISLARQSVHQLFGSSRGGGGNDQNNLLLQKVLQQISMMEQQMQKMEREITDQRSNPSSFNSSSNGSSSAGPDSAGNMMEMMNKLQNQMKQAEAARMATMEAEFKQRAAAMAEKEKRLDMILSGLNIEALEEKLQKVQDLEKNMDLQKIQAKLSKIDAIEARMAAGDFGGGPIRAYDELTKTVQDLQKLIFDDNTPEKERAAANIELEKAMKDLEKCPEFIAKRKEAEEKWKKENAPLNAKAYTDVIAKLRQEAQGDRERFRKKMEKNPELQLLLLKKEAILKKYMSDFNSYVLSVSQQELRALFHHMPKFRSNQTTQLQFVQTLENKIRENEKNKLSAPPKPVVKRTGRKFKVKKAPAGGGGGMSFLDELKKKRQKIN